MTQKQKDHTKELRERWNRAKRMLTDKACSEIDAIRQTHGLNISQTGFMVVSMEMKQQGLAGIPYLDAKTYKGWKDNGFRVRKGEKSTLGSITWVGVGKKEPTPAKPDGESGFMFPKSYNLFHRSQVDAVGSPDDKPEYDHTTKTFDTEEELEKFVNDNLSTDKSIETQTSYHKGMRNFRDKDRETTWYVDHNHSWAGSKENGKFTLTNLKKKNPKKTTVRAAKPQSNAKLLSMADTLTAKIKDKLRPMTQNPTPKRTREYNSRLWEGENLARLKKLLLAMASCIDADTLPEELKGISKKADLAKLVHKNADSSNGYYSCVVSDDYYYSTPEALAAQKLIEGNQEEERKQHEANEIAKMKQSLLLQKIDDFFPTPDIIIERMVELLDIGFGDRILEPSAGMGNILEYLPAETTAIEQNSSLFKYLQKTQPQNSIIQGDFLSMNGDIGKFDRIIMNPPFSRGADIKHIKHALEHLNEGGKLVTLCANGPRQAKELMPLADLWEDLPQGSFKQAGTNVNTALLVIEN